MERLKISNLGGRRRTSFVCEECGKDFNKVRFKVSQVTLKKCSLYKVKKRHKLFPAHVRRCLVQRFTCQCPDVPLVSMEKMGKGAGFKAYKEKAQHMQVKFL